MATVKAQNWWATDSIFEDIPDIEHDNFKRSMRGVIHRISGRRLAFQLSYMLYMNDKTINYFWMHQKLLEFAKTWLGSRRNWAEVSSNRKAEFSPWIKILSAVKNWWEDEYRDTSGSLSNKFSAYEVPIGVNCHCITIIGTYCLDSGSPDGLLPGKMQKLVSETVFKDMQYAVQSQWVRSVNFVTKPSFFSKLNMTGRFQLLKTVISSGNGLPNTHQKFGGSEIFEGSKVGQRTNHRTNFLGA